jgi:radical SAM superfamily enzyme YgiQ (UPF0313 family)
MSENFERRSLPIISEPDSEPTSERDQRTAKLGNEALSSESQEKFEELVDQAEYENVKSTMIRNNKIGTNEAESKENVQRPIQRIAIATTNQMETALRAVSKTLKEENYDVMKLFLYEDERHQIATQGYSSRELQAIVDKIEQEKMDALALSVYGVGRERAYALAKKVKQELHIPIIMGGPQAILKPKECLDNYADAVCLGEGENGFIDLLENWDTRMERENRNFVIRPEDLEKIDDIRSPLLTEEQISRLRFDFTYHNYFALQDGQMLPLTADGVRNPKHHQTNREKKTAIYASDRGCPLNCTFCSVGDLRAAYVKSHIQQRESPKDKPVNYLRRKHVPAIIVDFEDILKENPSVEFFNIMNDDTAARSVEELQEFSRQYKEKIDVPFYCMVSPLSLWDKKAWADAGKPKGLENLSPEFVVEGRQKIRALVDAGLEELNMGIQANGDTCQNLYGRPQRDDMVLQVTNMLQEFARADLDVKEQGKLDLFYDFIIHNPLETKADIKKTVDLVKQLKTPFDLVPHTLYISEQSRFRHHYEDEKRRATEEGRPYERVIEDINDESSDYHDTYRFYDFLAPNRRFVMNTVIEFMAGRHDEKMAGRIPRYAKDLLNFDVFKKVRENHLDLQELLDQQKIKDSTLSVDLLTADQIDHYLWENRDVFKELFVAMHERHPIVQSNERKEPEASRKGRQFSEGQ